MHGPGGHRPLLLWIVPERGDIAWLQFDPQTGHEQAGKRPALVLSPSAYNGRVGLALLCPIASQQKGYPFEVALPAGLRIQGVVLADQVKSLDWRFRRAKRADGVPPAVLEETVAKIRDDRGHRFAADSRCSTDYRSGEAEMRVGYRVGTPLLAFLALAAGESRLSAGQPAWQPSPGPYASSDMAGCGP